MPIEKQAKEKTVRGSFNSKELQMIKRMFLQLTPSDIVYITDGDKADAAALTNLMTKVSDMQQKLHQQK